MIYVTGDMHGERDRILRADIKRLKKGDTLIVLGDFGFVWDGSDRERKFLKQLGDRRYNICFIDGTHENYDLLNKCGETIWNGGRVHRVSGHLFHMCRGQIFNIEGISFFTFGGGESADRELRHEHITWWRNEMPTKAEMIEGAENIDQLGGKVDVVLTHEPPTKIKSSILLRDGKVDHINKLNGYLQEFNEACEFKKWYFGSVHEDRVITARHTAVFSEVININSDLEAAL